MGSHSHPHFYRNPPEVSLKALPPWAKIRIPLDGGFWIVHGPSGARIRRITKADLKLNALSGLRDLKGDEE